ncbi:MAG: LLM class flavin-dependent oxidoreductase [Chryseolinea sp.]
MSSKSIPYSILDLATIAQDRTIADSFHDSLKAAQLAESLGYKRYWLAEHHNSAGVGSAATSVLIGYIAQGTKTIRVGSGGIMLPNHSPYIIAEQFGTLATLYPNRIDLGLGRAPGTDQLTAQAIGRQNSRIEEFPNDIKKLQTYFSVDNKNSAVRAIPGEGLDIPIWVLGSSLDSARLAGAMGLPYAFASHFSPYYLLQALELYRSCFKPSAFLSKPYTIAGANVLVADSNDEASYLFTSVLQLFLGVITGRRQPLQRPVEDIHNIWTSEQQQTILNMLAYSFVGSQSKVASEIQGFVEQTKIDEIIVTSHIYDQGARLKSMTLFSEVMREKVLT